MEKGVIERRWASFLFPCSTVRTNKNETPIFRLKKLCLDRAFADRIKNVYKEEVTYIQPVHLKMKPRVYVSAS